MHHLAQVRGVRHSEGVHDPAVYQMLTGHRHPSSAGGLTVQPTDFPQIGSLRLWPLRSLEAFYRRA